MKNLETKIAELKQGRTLVQLKKEDVKSYYKVKSLASKLSTEKAYSKGNFISKQDLVDYKKLIIWAMNRSNYNGYLNLKDAMSILLNEVEGKKIVYKTKAGIKGIVTNLAVNAALENIDDNLRKAHGLSVLDCTNGNPVLESFTQHKLNVLS